MFDGADDSAESLGMFLADGGPEGYWAPCDHKIAQITSSGNSLLLKFRTYESRGPPLIDPPPMGYRAIIDVGKKSVFRLI